MKTRTSRIAIIGNILLFVLLFTSSCADDKSRDAAKEAALSINSSEPAPAPTPAAPIIAGVMSVNLPKVSASKGENTCLNISATNFQDVVSMQYTMAWNPKLLKFSEVKGFKLPGLGSGNFGNQLIDKGLLTYSWFDGSVRGVTLPDGATLYQVCFEVVGPAGSTSDIQFTEDPVIYEITNTQGNFLELKPVNGSISIK